MVCGLDQSVRLGEVTKHSRNSTREKRSTRYTNSNTRIKYKYKNTSRKLIHRWNTYTDRYKIRGLITSVIIVDKIIDSVKKNAQGYRLREHQISIVCYTDDRVLIAECEDDLQRMLHNFKIKAREYKMHILTEKTKLLTISKEPLRSKSWKHD